MPTAKRYSKKREAILKVLQETCIHPTADWVYQKLKSEYPDLSLGTVYRNLAAFREEGTITSLGVVDGQERFDAITTPHCHFVCTACGQVEDIPWLTLPEEMSRAAHDTYGVLVERCRLTLEGVCRECQQKEKVS